MTHLPGPACLQRTQQERDDDSKENNVSKVVRMTAEILGSHDVRVRIMVHETQRRRKRHVSTMVSHGIKKFQYDSIFIGQP
jgi:hypothetical protein